MEGSDIVKGVRRGYSSSLLICCRHHETARSHEHTFKLGTCQMDLIR